MSKVKNENAETAAVIEVVNATVDSEQNSPFATDETVTEESAEIETAKKIEDLPASVTLSTVYGYYDDDGNMRMWQPGQVVTEVSEIEDLIARDAPLLEEAD